MLDSLLPPLLPLAVTALVSFAAGLARGFSGFGSAMIFIPVAGAALGPQMAAVLLLLVDNIAALPMIRPAWKLAARREVAVLVAGTVIGTPIGMQLLLHADPHALRWVISVTVFLLLGLLISGWRYRGAPSRPVAFAVGATSGLFSGAVQLGGPPVIAYWMGISAPAAQLRANIVLFFAFSSLVVTAVFLLGGLITLKAIVTGLVLLPIYTVAVRLGMRLFGLASEATFRRLCYALIALSAVLGLPLWDSLRQ
ncbi:sulfite exporter TauE/SafE family protein [Acetobacteraceae bacterium H6797]|nr:sulfite exporter TauE/SafE family protein [Acetobacteraceae bacterium H6797]